MSRFKPRWDNVLVKRDEAKKEVSESGIVYKTSESEPPLEGTVLDRGFNVNQDLEVGNKVVFGRYSGTDITVDGGDLLLLRDEEILGVLQPLQ